MARVAALGNLPPPTFDLDAWAANYDGPLVPFRLAHVAVSCPALTRRALELALAACRAGRDVRLHARLLETAADRGCADLVVMADDAAWAARKEEENRRELARLEGELRGYKNNLIRESIRMGTEDLGLHHLRTGGPVPDTSAPPPPGGSGYGAAWHAFTRMRDYCTTPAHVAGMTVRLLLTAFVQAASARRSGAAAAQHHAAALATATRLRDAAASGDPDPDRAAAAANVASGLAHLALADYRAAADDLLRVPLDAYRAGPLHGVDCERQLATAHDVAVVGGLCALATLSRDELADRVLAGPFRAFLEQEPHVRRAVGLYVTAKYRACLDALLRHRADWCLDLHLGAPDPSTGAAHADALLARVRERALTAHLASYAAVSLASLAAAFPPPATPDGGDDDADPERALAAEARALISRGALDARLDAVRGALVAPPADRRAEVHHAAAQAAADVERTLLLRLHRVNLTLAGLEVPRSRTGGWEAARNGP